MKHSLRWIVAALMVLVLTAGLVGSVQAVAYGQDGSLPAGQTVDDDLVLTGNSVSMDGTVTGTFIAAGQTVTVNGKVQGDAILLAQSVTLGPAAVIEGNLFVASASVVIQGKVNESVFGAAGTFSLSGVGGVARNLYLAGYNLDTSAGSSVGRDLSAAVYQANLAGATRNLYLAGGAIDLAGVVNGDAVLDVASPGQQFDLRSINSSSYGVYLPPTRPAGLRIAESAKITGKLTYTSQNVQTSTILAAPAGGIVYQTPVPSQAELARANRPAPAFPDFNVLATGFWVWDLLRNMVVLILLGILAAWLTPGLFRRTVVAVQQKPLQSAGIGLLGLVIFLVAVPVVAVLLGVLALFFGLLTLVDLVGIVLGLGFALYGLAIVIFALALFWVGRIVLAYTIGEWIFRRMNSPAATGRFWPGVLGAVIFALLAAIPVIGWLFSFVVALVGIGAMYYALRPNQQV